MFLSAVNFSDLNILIAELRKLNNKAIFVIGMGERGAGLSIKGLEIKVYPPPLIELPIVDTNGAGDSLAMGFLYSYYFLNKSIEESLLLGQITARFTCSLKTPKLQFLDNNQLISYLNEAQK